MLCRSCHSDLPAGAAFCGVCGFRTRERGASLVGTIVDGRYQLEERIAAGGFGAIYRATHVETGHDVALKVLHADLAADDNLAARFRREGATLARLRDPHTVMTYEVGEAPDGTLYIAMELLRGTSLHQRFHTAGRIPWRAMLAIMRGVCSSLAEAHALGIVHRDLKPANIHLEAEPTPDFVKVLDFGVAKLVAGGASDDGSELTRIGTAIGTVDYMSPEQLVSGPCDGRSDIYALGVVAYEMMTGQRPFAEASGPISLITAVFTKVPAPLAAVADAPQAVEALIMRCLERDPESRFQHVGQLMAAIDAVLAGFPARHPRTLSGFVSTPAAVDAPAENTLRDVPVVVPSGLEAAVAAVAAPVAPELAFAPTSLSTEDDPVLALGTPGRGLPALPVVETAGQESWSSAVPCAPAPVEGARPVELRRRVVTSLLVVTTLVWFGVTLGLLLGYAV